jgi:hypothetical protein
MLLLHLSDLHFGPNSRFAGESPDPLAAGLAAALGGARISGPRSSIAKAPIASNPCSPTSAPNSGRAPTNGSAASCFAA